MQARTRSARRVSVRLTAVATTLFAVLGVMGCASEPSAELAPPTVTATEPLNEAETAPKKELRPEELRHEQATAIVDGLTLEEAAASIVMASIPSTDSSVLQSFVAQHKLGGFILMGENIPANGDNLRELTSAMSVDPELPLLIAIDEEGGEVTRLPWDTFAGANTLKYEPPSSTSVAFAGRAELLADAGININFGVVADFTSDAQSFIFGRSLGTTPDESTARVEAAVEAETGLVASTLKHFPGHGAAPGDSHAVIPETQRTYELWRAEEAIPFIGGIEAGAELLMFGHLAYPSVDALPASLSNEWHRIARDDLEFTGVTVTDDLGMLVASGLPEYQDPVENTVRAIAAGNDLVLHIAGMDETLLAQVIAGIATAASTGELPEERLTDAAVKVAELRLSVGEAASQ